jgi:hypothetical protein
MSDRLGKAAVSDCKSRGIGYHFSEYGWPGTDYVNANLVRITFMKTIYISLLPLCFVLSACDRRSEAIASASELSSNAFNDPAKRQQEAWDAYDRQAKQTDDRLKTDAALQQRSQEMFKAQEVAHQRAVAMLDRQEQMMKRQEDDLLRFEKILDTWELQQKQYQKYLDSLQK